MALVLRRFFPLSHSELESASLKNPPSRAWQTSLMLPPPGQPQAPLFLDHPTTRPTTPILLAGPATYQLLLLFPMKLRFLSLERKLGGGGGEDTHTKTLFRRESWFQWPLIPTPHTHSPSPGSPFPPPSSSSDLKTRLFAKPVTKGND